MFVIGFFTVFQIRTEYISLEDDLSRDKVLKFCLFQMSPLKNNIICHFTSILKIEDTEKIPLLSWNKSLTYYIHMVKSQKKLAKERMRELKYGQLFIEKAKLANNMYVENLDHFL